MSSFVLKGILNLLKEQRGFDFTGYRSAMLERRIQKRIYASKSEDLADYFEYLKLNTSELDHLVDVFTINVSRFFRNSLTFEYISKMILPEVLNAKLKIKTKGNNLRVWSAGCSFGEEPYSMAILLNEYFRKEDVSLPLNIFATDIDKKALKRAVSGIFDEKRINKVKHGILERYFTQDESTFNLNPDLKKMVRFSFHDILDKTHIVPSDSIYGGFDIVLCRNVLIYFNPEKQKIIFDKLYRSLNPDGYLVLGEAETPVERFKQKFKQVNKCCKIYKKV